ncbi:hypothetical protein E2C01_063857 [Portunus trituberculatus]|uniref:Uncharacterized protein n=1 Tax=Portunus trituberculatus TaxID=210409 RepID=A0A5B7HK61_PORTR|nr:hypothetical protein [Portunus trituberculatus]
MNEGTLCTMHQALAELWGSFRGGRTHFMTVAGAWCGAGHCSCEPCEARQGCIVTSLTPTGLLGRTLGEEGFDLVPVQISSPKWRKAITTPATLS